MSVANGAVNDANHSSSVPSKPCYTAISYADNPCKIGLVIFPSTEGEETAPLRVPRVDNVPLNEPVPLIIPVKAIPRHLTLLLASSSKRRR